MNRAGDVADPRERDANGDWHQAWTRYEGGHVPARPDGLPTLRAAMFESRRRGAGPIKASVGAEVFVYRNGRLVEYDAQIDEKGGARGR